MEESCENCKFWVPPSKEFTGYCRRYPPQVHGEVYGDSSDIGTIQREIFPETRAGDWCGEWKQK